MKTGIYKLIFNGTDKVYIGQSRNIEARFRQHISSFKPTTKCLPNYKLQRAYSIYGIPTLEVVEELQDDKATLLERERYYVDLYDSIHNGFNIVIPELNPILKGEDNANAQYTNDQYIQIATMLVTHSRIPLMELAESIGVSYNILKHLSALESHTWIKDTNPELWSKLLEIKNKGRMGLEYRSSYTNTLVSPSGIEYTVGHLTNFAKEHGLSQPKLSEVLNGNRLHHKGWHLIGTKPDFIFSIINTKTNEIIYIWNGGGSLVAKRLGFSSTSISSLKLGRINFMGDWKLYQK